MGLSCGIICVKSKVEAIIRSPTNMAAANGGVMSHYASHW